MNILYVDKRVPFFQEVLGTKSGLHLECCSTDLQTGVHVLSFCDPGFHGKNISLQRKDPASPTLETSAWDRRCHQLTHGPIKLPSWGEGITEQAGGHQTWSGHRTHRADTAYSGSPRGKQTKGKPLIPGLTAQEVPEGSPEHVLQIPV